MVHYLRIHDDYDEIRLALVCTAAPGSPCRLRPADGREDWTYADADLIDSGVCWAVEWADEGGCVTSGAAEGVTWPLVPVTVEYEYGIGPVVAPVIPQPDLPIRAEHDRERAEHAEAALARVRELHMESRSSMSALYPNPLCECGKDYPCPTIAAFGGEQS